MKLKALAVFFIIFSTLLFPQRRDNVENYNMRSRIEKLHQFELQKMKEELNLDDQTIEKIKVFQSSNFRDMRRINRDLKSCYDKLEDAIVDNKGSNECENIVRQIQNLEESRYSRQKQFLNDIKSLLTDEQFAKFLVFRHKMQNIMKKFIQNRPH